VADAIDLADPGDTVIVPAGSATWDESLVIDKGIILKGAGIGQTVITSNITASSATDAIISFQPASPGTNTPLRITGFTLDCAEKCSGIYMGQSTENILDQIRIDHNRICNCFRTAITGRCIYLVGNIFGVIDNNQIEAGEGKSIDAYGNSNLQWAMPLDRSFGLNNRMYYEDNTFTSGHTYHSAGHGGRYVTRYNNYTYTDTTSGLFPIFDIHGNQSAGCATMVAEIYGNTINLGTKGGGLFDQRGGQAVIFNNTVNSTSSVSAKCREEYPDDLSGYDYLQHVTNSYYWANYKNGTTRINCVIMIDPDWENGLVENVDFFNQQTSFDGSVGMGVGTLANRPASCTLEGAGYWATDENTLYRWHNGAWEFLFTPYTYPHPLRTEGPTADIVLGPPVGNTEDGASLQAITTDTQLRMYGYRVLADSDTTVYTMHAKIAALDGACKCAIYSVNPNNSVGELLGITTEVVDPEAGWHEFPLVLPVDVTQGTYYYLMIWASNHPASVYYSTYPTSTIMRRWNVTTPPALPYDDWPDPFPLPSQGITQNRNLCIYAQ